MRGRIVLVLDDILDEGDTLAAIRESCSSRRGAAFCSAVFADKDHRPRPKPIAPISSASRCPNRYVFGFGMDVYGSWRNLPAIYALKPDERT